jgi:lysophospholipase L1-like esterase
MAKRKVTSRRHTPARDVVPGAVAAGEKLARAALDSRDKRRKSRKRLQSKLQGRVAPVRRALRVPELAIPPRTLSLLGSSANAGVLIAEGDSWFDYPGDDVLALLEDEHLFEVESVARAGDRVEDMAHSEGQFEKFTRRLEKLLRAGKIPRAILLSGGGNDIAGDDFAVLLNHATSPLPALNEDVVRGVIDVRLRAAYVTMIAGLTSIAQELLDRPIPIVTHGYGYAVPDGRGFLGGFSFLPGPWLEPGLHQKGHRDTASNQRLVAQLIDRFNAMLQGIAALPQFAHVHHLDLRKLLRSDAGYQQHWANELHPSKLGFALVAEKYARLIEKL